MSQREKRAWAAAITIGDLVDREAERGDRLAVAFPDERLTYAELAHRSTEASRRLIGLGVSAGDHVGILMPNCVDYVVSLVAVAKVGAVAVPINARFKTQELGQIVAHAELSVLLVKPGSTQAADYPALVETMLAEGASGDLRLRHVVSLGPTRGGMISRSAWEAAGEQVTAADVDRAQARVRVRDIALLMYTSGTTSRPKGCLLTHEALVRHGHNVARSRFGLTDADRFWNPLPLFHIGGIVPLLGCLSAGAAYFHAGHFDPDVALNTLERERITVAYPAFETIWLGVVNHPGFADADLSALRLIQNIAVPERLAYLQRTLPTAVQVSSFGSTESSSNLTLTSSDDALHDRIETLGRPLPGIEVRIVDHETGGECVPGEVGELLFRGYSLFEGYFKEPELTAQALEGGWFHSGDLACLDDQGRLIYAGRLKDMLKVGGENVSAVEVESYLVTHPAIEIVQVVAAPDDHYAEVPAAFVQLRSGAKLTERELIDFCVGRIATYKIPRYVRFVTEWPMSGTKIQKFALREQIAGELDERGISVAPKITGDRS